MPIPSRMFNASYFRARGKAAAHALLSVLPARQQYRLRALIEKVAFNFSAPVGALPDIFHYWSNTYLRPRFEALGFSSPEDFFLVRLSAMIESHDGAVRILSIGSGRCELEIQLAQRLVERGQRKFEMVCLDLNPAMLKQGEQRAVAAGVREQFAFRASDVRALAESDRFDAVIANQCLHHIVELERLFDSIHRMIGSGGIFLTSDVIGRNGHRLWPEALDAFMVFWDQLPKKYKFDRATGRTSDAYVNYDHSNVGFEGIRAEDVLPLLVERFHFSLFVAHTNIVLPFVDRRFGFNFDPTRPADRAFIDQVAARDIELVDSGTLTPTQMVAELSSSGSGSAISLNGRPPADCVHPKLDPRT